MLIAVACTSVAVALCSVAGATTGSRECASVKTPRRRLMQRTVVASRSEWLLPPLRLRRLWTTERNIDYRPSSSCFHRPKADDLTFRDKFRHVPWFEDIESNSPKLIYKSFHICQTSLITFHNNTFSTTDFPSSQIQKWITCNTTQSPVRHRT